MNKLNQQSLLSTAILNRDRLYDLLEYPGDMFTYPEKHIYDAVIDLHNSDMDIDLIAIRNNIIQNARNYDVNNLLSLYQLPTVINFKSLADEVFHEYKRNKIAEAAKDLFKKCQEKTIEYLQFVDEIASIKNNIDDRMIKNVTPIIDEFDRLLEPREKDKFYRTGLRELDDVIVGLFNGRLIVIAANTGQGKSTLARQITQDKRFLFFSLEMMKKEVAANVLMQYSGVPSWKIIAQLYSEDEKNLIIQHKEMARQKVKSLGVDDTFDIHDIVNTIKQKHRRGEIDGAVIDYIQLCTGAKGESQNIRVGYITRLLKQTAQSLNIPIVALSQLNRDNDKNDRRPELTDLRDSGSIEQDANQVIFLYTKKDDRLLDCPPAEIIVAKNRGGRVGKITGIVFDKQRSMFRSDDVKDFDSYSNPDYFNN